MRNVTYNPKVVEEDAARLIVTGRETPSRPPSGLRAELQLPCVSILVELTNCGLCKLQALRPGNTKGRRRRLFPRTGIRIDAKMADEISRRPNY